MTTLGRTPPMLSYFCVYNPTLGQSEENTKDQILYYTAKTVVPADVKMKQVGLAQALVNFSSAFSPSQPAQNVHAQKHRLIFFQPEPDFWIHMCVELGIMRKQTKDNRGKEKLVTEYLDHQLSDRALENLLRTGYEQFRLLNGTMTSILTATARRSSLMHLIEEFFSEWIWKWDFDCLDRMVFDVVFKGWPVQPLQRQDFLRIRDLDIQLGKLFQIAHLFLIDGNNGRLVYRSSSLANDDTVVLKNWVEQSQQMAAAAATAAAKPQSSKSSATTASVVKTLTRSISNYFLTSRTAEQTEGTEEEGGPEEEEQQPQGKIQDVVRVHLTSRSWLEQDEGLEEYYLVVYKHKDGFLWCFLLPAFAEGVEDWFAEPNSIIDLENAMLERNLEGIISAINESKESTEEKSLALGKNYRCLYYDHGTRNIKSTLLDQRKDAFTVSNDMLLQILDIKNDFETIPSTTEVYTRSTSNYWIAGRRVYNQPAVSAQQTPKTPTDDHQEPPTEDEEDDDPLYDTGAASDDYVEIYLVAAKKDTSLADVEETIRKMSASVVQAMRIE